MYKNGSNPKQLDKKIFVSTVRLGKLGTSYIPLKEVESAFNF